MPFGPNGQRPAFACRTLSHSATPLSPFGQLRYVVRRHLRPPHDFVACASRGSNERVSTAHSVGQASVATAIATTTVSASASASGVRAATITATVARAEVTSNIVARGVTMSCISKMV